jgi:hypothetical protein
VSWCVVVCRSVSWCVVVCDLVCRYSGFRWYSGVNLVVQWWSVQWIWVIQWIQNHD